MGCTWDELGTTTELGEVTANADWLEEIRPYYLRHSFPISITLPSSARPIFFGVLDMPHWRPTYIRVKGDEICTLRTFARTIRDAGKYDVNNNPWPKILLNKDAADALEYLITLRGPGIPNEARFLFIYTLERMKFPFEDECEVRYIGPPVPDLSLNDVRRGNGKIGGYGGNPEIRSVAPTTVVTAIIDTEIGIANERFRSGKEATRIAHYWRQQQEVILPATGVATGMVFHTSDINKLLMDSNGNEQEFYHLLRSGSYGTRGAFLANGAALGPGQSDIMESWRQEVALRLKHMLELEAVHSGPRDPQLVRFITDPYGEKDPDYYLDARDRAKITKFVLGKKPEEIAKQIKLIEPSYWREDENPPESWRQILRDANYAARGRSRPVGFRAGHGTHIMDIAAGFPQDRAPADRPIVAVEMPDYVIEDTTGARLEAFCLLAMRQILRWVDDWGATAPGNGDRVPVVVNISLGNAAGPRNGTGFLEQELTRLAAARETPGPGRPGVATKIVMAAGNGYRSRLAGQVQLGTGAHETLDWCVPPGDKSASYLEIRASDPSKLEITLEEPGGVTTTRGPKQGAVLKCNRQVVGRLYSHIENNDAVLTLALAPTLALDAPYQQAPAGTYRVTLTNLGSDTMNINLGVQRDETLSGYPLYGKQSYLDHPTVVERDPVTGDHDLPESLSPVGRENTISAFATSISPQMFVVGGAVASQVGVATESPEAPATRYTGSGPTSGPRLGPDLAGIAADGAATRGQRAAGYFSGSSVVFSGTSTAAAHVTRRMVDVLASKGNLGHHDMLEAVLGGGGLPGQDQRLGYGILVSATAPGRSPRR